MSNINVIHTQDLLGRTFNVYGNEDNPLFLAKDVAEWIDYDKSSINKMLNNVDDDEKVRNIIPTLGGNQEAWFLTEDGLYEVLMQSRKQIAKSFKKEVKKILKQIRHTGGYIPIKDESEEDFLARALIVAQNTLAKKDKLLQSQKQLLEKQQPLVSFAEACMQSPETMKVGEVAKLCTKNGLKIGQNRLFDKLRDWGLIFKNSTEPTQRAVERGYFEVAQGVKKKPSGEAFTWTTTYVTAKGQAYIVDRLKKETA